MSMALADNNFSPIPSKISYGMKKQKWLVTAQNFQNIKGIAQNFQNIKGIDELCGAQTWPKLELCCLTNRLQMFYLLQSPKINCVEFEFGFSRDMENPNKNCEGSTKGLAQALWETSTAGPGALWLLPPAPGLAYHSSHSAQ